MSGQCKWILKLMHTVVHNLQNFHATYELDEPVDSIYELVNNAKNFKVKVQRQLNFYYYKVISVLSITYV